MKKILIKAHYFIELIKHYYGLFCQVYIIIIFETPEIEIELAFQIYFKAPNHLIWYNNLN